MTQDYVPDAGDIVWLNLDPQKGREQAGHRPCVVLSPKLYNQKTNLMVCCPMTTKIKGYPFEVLVSKNPESVVLADQIKSFDWRTRGVVYKGKVSHAHLNEIRKRISLLIRL